MKKVSLLVIDKYRQESLLDLRRMGLLHIKYVKSPVSPDIESLSRKIDEAEKALLILSKYAPRKDQSHVEKQQASAYASQIVALDVEKENYIRRKEEIEQKISWYENWGEFSVSSLRQLADENVYIKLYKCYKKELDILRKTKAVEVIKRKANNYYIAVVSLTAQQDVSLQEVVVPQQDLQALKAELKQADDKILYTDNLLIEMTCYKKALSDYLAQLKKSLDFNRVKSSMQEEAEIAYLQGFIPANEVLRLRDLADKKGWAYLIQDPDNLQEVPTLIRNPRWLRIIEPVFKFMGTVPGYSEYDISFSFLVFFSLFFAMLIGDAGYGLVFFILTYLLRKKMPHSPLEPFILMYVLSFTTLIWGAISGTWFGFEQIARIPLFNNLIVPRLYSFTAGNQFFLMHLCFLIGALHLTLAHSIVGFRVINSLMALSQLGWIGIVWGIFFLAETLVLGKPFPPYAKYLLMAGAASVVLFSNPQKNILKGVCISLANLPLKLISSFGDTLSYLRLFAVGTASVMVAASFNEMALTVGFNSVLRGLGAALILLAGHALNIVLGLMSVLVHGIRLNMLEFSGHLNMEWSGIEYKPFKE